MTEQKIDAIILAEAGLSYLGLGAQPPTAEWGTMLADAREFVLRAWWVVTLPGIAQWHALDLSIYYQDSLQLLLGRMPYRDFALEYPPLALLPFTYLR